MSCYSPDIVDDSDDDIAIKPVKKQKTVKSESDDEPVAKPAKKKAANGKSLNDFFDKVPAKPTARKASGSSQTSKAKAPAKKPAAKKVVVSDDDDLSMDDVPPPPKRTEAPKRAARAIPKTYIDISEDDGDGNSGSEFEDYD